MIHILKGAAALLTTAVLCSAQTVILQEGFEDGDGGWNLYISDDSNAAASLSNESGDAQEGDAFQRVTVTETDTLNWHIQLQDPDWTCEKDVEYHLSFYVRSDAEHSIQVAVSGDSASPYTYRTGSEFAVNTTWKKIDYYYTSDVAGSNATSFNIYCGYATGTYDFDNIVIAKSSGEFPETISIPSQSAWESGEHRNLFAELGYTQEQIDERINSTFQQLFFGDRDAEAIYSEEGTDMGFINRPGSGEIITEGQSYGMMIAVQMDRQDIFDRLWKFAYTYMKHHDGDQKGTFSWKVEESSPHAMIDPNPAPDGEEYFVTSLLFAEQRWGSKSGVFNYQAQADSILDAMLHKEPNTTVVPMIDSDHAMILFTPDVNSPAYTDPSYHLPAFYTIWSHLATNDKEFWQRMADSSRAFFHRACHPTTGLTPDYAEFDGTPKPVDFNRFGGLYHSDSWRVPMNIAMDYSWFKADDWQIEQLNRVLTFFDSQDGDYNQTYEIDGTPAPEDDEGTMYPASQGQIACNAVAALASDDPVAWNFVDRFWKMPTPTGEWRYYSGMLTMLSLLHVSGNFKIWGNPSLGSIKDFHNATTRKSAGLISGPVQIFDLRGRLVAEIAMPHSVPFADLTSRILHEVTGLKNGNRVYLLKAESKDGVVVKRISNLK